MTRSFRGLCNPGESSFSSCPLPKSSSPFKVSVQSQQQNKLHNWSWPDDVALEGPSLGQKLQVAGGVCLLQSTAALSKVCQAMQMSPAISL